MTKFDIEKYNGSNILPWKMNMKTNLRMDNYLAEIIDRPWEITNDGKRNEMNNMWLSTFT